jgi:hypothetical protein
MAYKAIVVGVQGYPELPPALQGPENDAKKFFAWVTTHGGVDPDPVKGDAKLILDDRPLAAAALDARPTAETIKYEFDKLETQAKKSGTGRAGERLYLYLSGHGFGQDLTNASLLMPNATQDRTRHHIPGRPWADHFFSRGYFDEVLLFIDCCRERYRTATLNGPGTDPAVPPPGSRRFYGFASTFGLLAVERDIHGQMGGVFTAALLDGLNGGASEEDGRITGESLKAYLEENMRGYLSPDDLEDKNIATRPDLLCSPPEDQFIIANVPPTRHDVVIPLPPGSATQNRALFGEQGGKKNAKIAAVAGDGTEAWKLKLLRGTYLMTVNGTAKVVTVNGRGEVDVTDP